MIIDKAGLIEILKNSLDEIKGLGENEYYFKLEIIGIDKDFAPRAHGLQEKFVKAVRGYQEREAKKDRIAEIINIKTP